MAITQNLDSQRFEYTGDVQEFIVPTKGLYKLEVWGASGGCVVRYAHNMTYKWGIPGYGGYSCGYKYLEANAKLYICVGGKGEDNNGSLAAGGYNGGGNAGRTGAKSGGAGGGCTHIAQNNNRGELYGYEDYKSEVLIVAGGGGGGCRTPCDDDGAHSYVEDGHQLKGGDGGGLTGGSGEDCSCTYGPGTGGTQTEGGWRYSLNFHPLKEYMSGFGRAPSAGRSKEDPDYFFSGLYAYCSGAGGGWYSGGEANQAGASGGGSGYIGGVPTFTYNGKIYEPSTISGLNNGNGAAVITLIQRSAPSVYLGSREISAIYYGTRDITDIKIHN